MKMLTNTMSILITSVMLAMIGCSEPEQPITNEWSQATTSDEPTLNYNGVLDETNVNAALAALADHPEIKTISINSGGGFPYPAIRLAQVIVERQLTVEVRNLCGSACLLYVFTAGSNRRVTDGAVLAFHSAPAYDALLLKNIVSKDLLELTNRAYDTWSKLLIEKKIDSSIMIDQGLVLEPLCWRIRKNAFGKDEAVINYKYGIWVPPKEFFVSKGIDFTGELLVDKADFPSSNSERIKRVANTAGLTKPSEFRHTVFGPAPNAGVARPIIKCR